MVLVTNENTVRAVKQGNVSYGVHKRPGHNPPEKRRNQIIYAMLKNGYNIEGANPTETLDGLCIVHDKKFVHFLQNFI
eukprot:UN29156